MKIKGILLTSIILHLIASFSLAIDTSNLVVFISFILSIIANNIVIIYLFKDFKYKYSYLLISSIFLFNIAIYTSTSYFSDFLIYSDIYQNMNFLLAFIYIAYNVCLINYFPKNDKKRWILILYIISGISAYLALGFKINCNINLLVAILTLFLIEREPLKNEDKN